jgi:hypothetical protein
VRPDSGELVFDGETVAEMRGITVNALRRQVQMVFQDTLLHGSRERRGSPLSVRFLHDADGFWASKLQHPVQDADSNDNLGGLPAVRVRSQRVADHPLVAADVGLH